MRRRTVPIIAILFAAIVPTGSVVAQSAPDSQELNACANDTNLLDLLPPSYRDWLSEDVAYLISREERCVFLQLTNDSDRDLFIQYFWDRRNPDPESRDNAFEQEHYQRIAYSNDHFFSGVPGWQTDRGRIYTIWGPPDQIETGSGAAGGSVLPTEIWRYRYLEGIGENVDLEFVQSPTTGDSHLALASDLQEATPEATSFAPSEQCDCRGYVSPLESAELMMRGGSYAPTKFKDLEAFASLNTTNDGVEFDVSTEYVPVTHFMTLVPMKIKIPQSELPEQSGDPNHRALLELFLRIDDSRGQTVEVLEDSVGNPVGSADPVDSTRPVALQKKFPLRPGRYRLQIVIGDSDSGRLGSYAADLTVPAMALAR